MKLGYTIIYVPSVVDSLHFFNQVFGLEQKFLHESGDYGELETGNTVLAFASHDLGMMNFPDGFTRLSQLERPAGIEIALVTDDVASAIESAVVAGAKLMAEPHDTPWGQTIGYVRSPDGLLIELCTPVQSQ